MKKWFWTYLFPGLFGLLIYALVRLINDTLSEEKFWERPLTLNTIETAGSMLTGYILYYALQGLFRRFDKMLLQTFSYQIVLQELLWVVAINFLVINGTITPVAAITDDGLSWGDFAIINILSLLVSLVYYTFVRSNKLLRAYVNNKMQLEKITTDHLQTELKFLKAQYHPHFLFNALNTIYFQMDEDVMGAKRSIEKFSGLLRYQLYDQQQTVPVSRELSYLQNFIELQQVRTSEKLQLEVSFDPQLQVQQIYPLLLLPLVENAFKYVGGAYQISICAHLQQHQLKLDVCNSVPEKLPANTKPGIGLENLRRRLELLYPGGSSLQTGLQDHQFQASLLIDLNHHQPPKS